MKDSRRDQIFDIIKREFIGPDPLFDVPDRIQKNGEEILSGDPPHIRYIAGILYPQFSDSTLTEITSDEVPIEETELESPRKEESETRTGGTSEFLEDAEEIINLSNSFKPSAISMTAAVYEGDKIYPEIKAGVYSALTSIDPKTEKKVVRYLRSQLTWSNEGQPLELPKKGFVRQPINIDGKRTNLAFDITCRGKYKAGGYSLYTFSLENTNKSENGSVKDESCFFQTGFSLRSKSGFHELPDGERVTRDDDFDSNRLLYHNIKSFAVGHGCSVSWDRDAATIFEIQTETFPRYEIKPIIPSTISGVSLDMFLMSDLGNVVGTISELKLLCDSYEHWIDGLEIQLPNISDVETAKRHIKDCRDCLIRMREGVALLKSDNQILQAFQLMNRAMLLQQLHYGLPLQNWSDDGSGALVLNSRVEIPVITDKSTWYGNPARYGKWRPFQLAFILLNLKSMANRSCADRKIVDLIWFPTGGGKTEAYLGLSAFTIFIRRLKNKNDEGTAILMRYTLRLLTAQQYERASSMICACEIIRRENPDLYGDSRITIGLWVGGTTTPNKMQDAIKSYEKLYNGQSNVNPFVMLKCPWCGAQMGVVEKGRNQHATPGYKKKRRNGRMQFIFQCGNQRCEFSMDDNTLPLSVVDEEIYEYPPTLLLGTVDKFAMLPYLPEARSLFGIDTDGKRVTAPDLIIQDELHLISGPLGSMVGHYETMIHELCTNHTGGNVLYPKIISSTATISKAKEQCHALYACGKENVKQFPPSGLIAGDSFFAEEGVDIPGRQYVGILASGSTSNATTTIRLYAALLYAAKELTVATEDERDPYWTNVGYFNSIRELGQTETWIRQDIDEYLHIIYKRRFEDLKDGYRDHRRYIYRDEELTSRVRSDKIPFSLQNLGIQYPSDEKRPVDICLATNMISVGVDVPRLGLMCVAGQPKTTSEYIQATSRVGRSSNAPGLVFTIYNPGKPRDKSHYEHFQTYHSRIYCHVEPTSVTPFSPPLRERALHAIVIGLLRLFGDADYNSNPPKLPAPDKIDTIKSIVRERIARIEPEELAASMAQIDEIIEDWKTWEPRKYSDFRGGNDVPLMFQAGSLRNAAWGTRGFPTPTSMRSVDASCEAVVLENRYLEEE
ncbi:hypothetical protein LJB90_02350 [Eubacteriales bacterium OttesenSCG-928-G02]|nr:hypothetical protein [Eubacteriales bacterium OttesenSCG-928-G02]